MVRPPGSGAPPRTVIPASAVTGYVDHFDVDRIMGWVADASNPASPPPVTIRVDGATVGTALVGGERKDAVAAGHAGARAFSFCLTPHISPGTHLVEVVAGGRPLPEGRRRFVPGGEGAVGECWSRRYAESQSLVTRWWQCEHIIRRINRKVCGEPLAGCSDGMHQLALRTFAASVPLGRAVSIGCGTAYKEIAAMRCGLIGSFVGYELSQVAIERAREAAAQAGLADRMEFRCADGLQEVLDGQFDAVYWNNSLHHMPDAAAAVAWSWRALRPGGAFLMDDFVGPTRMQWSDRLMGINIRMRRALPPQYLQDPQHPGARIPDMPVRLTPEQMIAIDPSECADSGAILPAISAWFPNADVRLTGGGIYHLGLNDVLHNIVAAGDMDCLDALLEMDDLCAQMGETHYAVVIAAKGG